MAVQKTCTGVVRDGAKFYVNFSDGSQREYNDLAHMRGQVRTLDEGPEAADLAELWLIAWWLKRSTEGTNVGLITGKTITVDANNGNMLQVQ